MDPQNGPPLMKAWAPSALQLFSHEFEELEELINSDQTAYSVEIEQTRELANAEVDALAQRAGSAAGGRVKTGKGGRDNQEQAAIFASERDRRVAERVEVVEKARNKQTWHKLIQSFNSKQQEAERLVGPVQMREQAEYSYFCAHQPEYYSMEDILTREHAVPVAAPPPQAKSGSDGTTSAAGTWSTAAGATGTASGGASGTAEKGGKKKSNTAADAAGKKKKGRGASVLGAASPLAGAAPAKTAAASSRITSYTGATPDFIMDAVAFSERYNKELEKEYGYKPVMQNSISGHSAGHTAVAENADALRALLDTHRPGDGTTPPDFCVTTIPATKTIGASSEAAATTTTTAPATTAATARISSSSPSTAKSVKTKGRSSGATGPAAPFSASMPTFHLPPLMNEDRLSMSADQVKPPKEKSGVSSRATKRSGGGATSVVTSVSSPRARLAQVAPIDCTAKNRLIQLSAYCGQEAHARIRFTNRQAHRTRLRVHPSSHPWLTYTCTQIATVPGRVVPDLPPESPLTCGGYIEVEVCFRPTDTFTPLLGETLRVGYARELNSRSASGAQWSFYEVSVRCETILPSFELRSRDLPPSQELDADSEQGGKRAQGGVNSPITVCAFPYTFAMASTTLNYTLKNTGSTCWVNVFSNSPVFDVRTQGTSSDTGGSGTAVRIMEGGSVDLEIAFTPTDEGRIEADLIIAVVEDPVHSGASNDGDMDADNDLIRKRKPRGGGGGSVVLAEHTFVLQGVCVIPHVRIVQIDNMTVEASDRPQWCMTDTEEGPPCYVAENTTPDLDTEFSVVVLNDSPMPLPFFWIGETTMAADGASSAEMEMLPSEGVLPALSTMEFVVVLTPRLARPLAAVWNLFVGGLPDPLSIPEETLQSTPKDVIQFFTRRRLIPAVVEAEVRPDMYADPFAAFERSAAMQSSDITDTFVTGFYIHTQPVPPSAVLIPPVLEETVECLVGYENIRRVTLQNDGPRPLHFYFDPLESETRGLCTVTPPSDDVAVVCHPRTGTIAPHDAVTIIVRFTVLHVGHHFVSVDCFIPEIMDGAAPGTPCTHHLGILVSGVGPVVHVSTSFLDFGLIELGLEAEASFTVTNDNPIPVIFDLQDPLLRDPPRFVFIPPNFRLGSGDSVEITVYRKAVSPDDAQTFFELVVRDGGATIAIETRATIQAPTMMLDDATVDFGRVPEGVWQERMFYISNASALDVPFTIELASPAAKHVDLDYPTSYLLRAGQQHVGITVRGRFTYHPAEHHDPDCYRALLGLRSGRTAQILLLRIACSSVEQLKVSVDVAPLRLGFGKDGVSQVYVPQPVPFPMEDYLSNLLWNLVDEKVMRESNRAVQEGGLGDDEVIELPVRPPVPSLRPMCGPVKIDVMLNDKSPVFMEQVLITIVNATGCESYYEVEALNYAPLSTATDMHAVGGEGEEPQGGAAPTKHSVSSSSAKAAAARRKSNARASKASSSSSPPAAVTASTAAGLVTITTKGKKAITLTDGKSSAVGWIDGERPVFWAMADRERQERQRRAALAGAQSLLLDGRGCCTSLEFDASGALNPYDTLELPLTTLANLPGRYEEIIRVRCGALPYVDVPLTCEVRGRPVLLDPTTSGLTVVDGKDVLVMPPVIASVGTSRRGLIVMNRVPRDVDVRVEIFPCASTFCVLAVDDSVEAGQVRLTLGPLTEMYKLRSQDTNGVAAATPTTFFLPAMTSKEIVIEYTPELNVVRDVLKDIDAAAAPRSLSSKQKGSSTVAAEDEDEDEDDRVRLKAGQEVDWMGSLVIHTEIARRSAFNDAFLIDEFYAANESRYPSTRVVRQRLSKDDLAGTEAAMDSITRSIPMLLVSRPLRTRVGTGVIRNNKILAPTEAERFLINRELARRQLAEAVASPRKSRRGSDGDHADANRRSGGDADAADDDDQASMVDSDICDLADDNNNPMLDAASAVLRPLEVLLAEEEERQVLDAFLVRRREEINAESAKYFVPIELLLRARCGVPRLSVQPSAAGVQFPLYHHDQRCMRTVRLTNNNSATLFFTLAVEKTEFFRVTEVKLLPTEIEVDVLQENDEESRRALRELSRLRWGNVTDLERARTLLESGMQTKQPASAAASAEVPPDELAAMHISTPMNTATGAAHSVYRLRGSDALDVTIEVLDPSNFQAMTATRQTAVLEGTLCIGIIDTSTNATTQPRSFMSSRTGTRTSSARRSLARSWTSYTAAKQEQRIPLLVSFKQPVVRCEPQMLWFRPGQLLHDGRPQPSYTQTFQIINHSAESVNFVLVESGRQSEPDLMRHTAAVVIPGGGQKLTTERKIAQVVRMPEQWPDDAGNGLDLVEDASLFSFTTRKGVLPAATLGGEPGRVTIGVKFSEHSNVRCECVFTIWANGSPTQQHIILRGDSRETEV